MCIQTAARVISQSDCLWIGAGAGIGVDSGLPDFRGDEGFWKAYPPLKRLGLTFYDMANPQSFHGDPTRAWGFYGHRLQRYRSTRPHQGFQILRSWCQELGKDSFVFTSNVDGHFQSSGFPRKTLWNAMAQSIAYNARGLATGTRGHVRTPRFMSKWMSFERSHHCQVVPVVIPSRGLTS